MFTTETRPYNLNNQDKSLHSITMKSGPLKLTVQFIHAFAFADQNLPVPVLLICPLALSRVKSIFLTWICHCTALYKITKSSAGSVFIASL